MHIDIYYDNQKVTISGKESESDDILISDVNALDAFWGSTESDAWLYTKDFKKTFKALRKKYKYIEAAGGLVKNAEGKYLLMFRRGKWDLPKGKAEKGETTSDTALREVEEETGVKGLTILSEIPSTYHMYAQNGKTILKRTYWYLMETNDASELIPQIEEDIEKVEWLDVTEFSKVYQNTFPTVFEVLKHS